MCLTAAAAASAAMVVCGCGWLWRRQCIVPVIAAQHQSDHQPCTACRSRRRHAQAARGRCRSPSCSARMCADGSRSATAPAARQRPPTHATPAWRASRPAAGVGRARWGRGCLQPGRAFHPGRGAAAGGLQGQHTLQHCHAYQGWAGEVAERVPVVGRRGRQMQALVHQPEQRGVKRARGLTAAAAVLAGGRGQQHARRPAAHIAARPCHSHRCGAAQVHERQHSGCAAVRRIDSRRRRSVVVGGPGEGRRRHIWRRTPRQPPRPSQHGEHAARPGRMLLERRPEALLRLHCGCCRGLAHVPDGRRRRLRHHNGLRVWVVVAVAVQGCQ
jgi:hypothetical protein